MKDKSLRARCNKVCCEEEADISRFDTVDILSEN
jgi:hypothetical protein